MKRQQASQLLACWDGQVLSSSSSMTYLAAIRPSSSKQRHTSLGCLWRTERQDKDGHLYNRKDSKAAQWGAGSTPSSLMVPVNELVFILTFIETILFHSTVSFTKVLKQFSKLFAQLPPQKPWVSGIPPWKYFLQLVNICKSILETHIAIIMI